MLSSTLYDEVQELPTSSFISLKNLLNYSMDSEILLFLILCGQDSIYEKLGYSQLEALSRRIRIRYALRALSMEETGGYISLCGSAGGLITQSSTSQKNPVPG